MNALGDFAGGLRQTEAAQAQSVSGRFNTPDIPRYIWRASSNMPWNS